MHPRAGYTGTMPLRTIPAPVGLDPLTALHLPSRGTWVRGPGTGAAQAALIVAADRGATARTAWTKAIVHTGRLMVSAVRCGDHARARDLATLMGALAAERAAA